MIVGDRRPKVLKQFLKLTDPRARMEFNQTLRGGGSMSSEVYAGLCKCAECAAPRLVLAEEVEVEQATWTEGEIHVRFDDGKSGGFDFVWLA